VNQHQVDVFALQPAKRLVYGIFGLLMACAADPHLAGGEQL
jgi:hypothetical protein